jgi:acylphosphatase
MRITKPLSLFHYPHHIAFALGLCAVLLAAVPYATSPARAKRVDASAVTAKDAAAPSAILQTSPAAVGQWGPLETLDTVPVHVNLLPDGRLLYWGRDKASDKWDIGGSCMTYTWHPTTKVKSSIQNTTTNLFCAGQSFLPDGRLLVAGGHVRDNAAPNQEGIGETAVNVFDYRNNTWTRVGSMNQGRWYPSNVTLADGETVIVSGYYRPGGTGTPITVNTTPDLFTSQNTIRPFSVSSNIPVYPYLHLAPNGQVFDAGAGPNPSQYFDPNANGGAGLFTQSADFIPDHITGTAVIYDSVAGKVLMTGGTSYTGGAILNDAEVIDLSIPSPFWRSVSPMTYRRKYPNATLLPDGKVLVTGGTQCQGTNNIGCPEGAATRPELWNPQTETWSVMAPNPSGIPRVYHSVGILLPDARVLVGGGGLPAAGGEVVPSPTGTPETCIDGASASNSVNCRTFGHKDVEIFSPPYLFTSSGTPAARPTISSAPSSVILGQTFGVGTTSAFQINSVVLVRLPSETHGFNFDQRRVVLNFQATGSTNLNVTTPNDARQCPPGYYMLFILDSSGVPSVASIVRVIAPSSLPELGSRIVRNTDGRLQVFYRGTGADINYSIQSSPGSSTWAAPVSLGAFINSTPVAVLNADGRAEVFITGSDNAIYHNWQLSPGSSIMSGWYALGGYSPGDLAVARNSDGRLQIFYRGGDNQLYTLSQSFAGSSTWSAHTSLGGTLVSGPSVASNPDGRLEVFVRGTDNALYHNWQTSTSGSSWSGWYGLGGYTNSTTLAVARNTDSYLQVFYRDGSTNSLFYIKQTPGAPGGWAAPVNLGGGLTSDPTVGMNADGRLEVFVRGTDNALYHIWQTSASSATWSGFAGLGGYLTSGAPVACNADGRLSVVVRGADFATLYYNAQASPGNAAWAGFGLVGGRASSF